MVAEFEERFRRILKRIYRSLQQNEIREEILDERRKIAAQWSNLGWGFAVSAGILSMFSECT